MRINVLIIYGHDVNGCMKPELFHPLNLLIKEYIFNAFDL